MKLILTTVAAALLTLSAHAAEVNLNVENARQSQSGFANSQSMDVANAKDGLLGSARTRVEAKNLSQTQSGFAKTQTM